MAVGETAVNTRRLLGRTGFSFQVSGCRGGIKGLMVFSFQRFYRKGEVVASRWGKVVFWFLLGNAPLGQGSCSFCVGFHVCKMVIIIVSASETCAQGCVLFINVYETLNMKRASAKC